MKKTTGSSTTDTLQENMRLPASRQHVSEVAASLAQWLFWILWWRNLASMHFERNAWTVSKFFYILKTNSRVMAIYKRSFVMADEAAVLKFGSVLFERIDVSSLLGTEMPSFSFINAIVSDIERRPWRRKIFFETHDSGLWNIYKVYHNRRGFRFVYVSKTKYINKHNMFFLNNWNVETIYNVLSFNKTEKKNKHWKVSKEQMAHVYPAPH